PATPATGGRGPHPRRPPCPTRGRFAAAGPAPASLRHPPRPAGTPTPPALLLAAGPASASLRHPPRPAGTPHPAGQETTLGRTGMRRSTSVPWSVCIEMVPASSVVTSARTIVRP